MFQHATVQQGHGRLIRVAAWLAITALITIGLLGASGRSQSVLAAETLNQTIPAGGISWTGVSAEECEGVDLDPGEVMWHFVLTSTSAGVGTILNVTFSDGSSQNVPATRKTGGTLHWFVFTGQVNLTGASTTATGGNLNLSHICAGEESSTETTTETTSDSSSS